MKPRLSFLANEQVAAIAGEAFQLLNAPGVRVVDAEARALLSEAGATCEGGIAHIPEHLVRRALESAPAKFALYDRAGNVAVRYGGDEIQFAPGSSCLNLLDSETARPRPALAADLVKLVQVAETLEAYSAQATAMVCSDVPAEIGDFYRLFLVLWYSGKPVVTGAFGAASLQAMLDLLAAEAGGEANLRTRPRAIFDVCPSPPLNWSEFASFNLVALARAGVPAELISVPIAGATAPVTLAGAVVQHAAELLSGLTIHQLASAGAPAVWGGAPAILDMRTGSAAMGAIETAMLNAACTQLGKSFGLPTHGYLVATDSKHVDAQAGMESASSALLGAMAGINMISGAGMLDSLACHSLEKLVIDSDAIGAARRAERGIESRGEDLALGMFAQAGLRGDFLKLPVTRREFRNEQYLPSEVIDRGVGGDEQSLDCFARASRQVAELLASYRRPGISEEAEQRMLAIANREAAKAGLNFLPAVEVSRGAAASKSKAQ